MGLRLHDVTVDCSHAPALARFWAAALEGYDVAPYSDDDLRWLAERGYAGPEEDPNVLVQPDGPGPRLWCQQVPALPPPGRLHLGLRADDLEAEVERLVGLGATVVHRGVRAVVLADPEGGAFRLGGVGAPADG